MPSVLIRADSFLLGSAGRPVLLAEVVRGGSLGFWAVSKSIFPAVAVLDAKTVFADILHAQRQHLTGPQSARRRDQVAYPSPLVCPLDLE